MPVKTDRLVVRPLCNRTCIAIVFCFLSAALTILPPNSVQADDNTPSQQPTKAASEEKQLPVILLTGFEPFGSRRPPNPSWEGIKNLNGTQWRGFRIVCKQLPVVWGVPLENFPGWIEQYKPVALFSFGQGGLGQFTIETQARNRRHKIRDNDGQLPPQKIIVTDGRPQHAASLDSRKYIKPLRKKGFPVRISKNAGGYLCEEALYCLEHLKTTTHKNIDVAFCHIPPLGSPVGNKTVTADYVQDFVLTFLDIWQTQNQQTDRPDLSMAQDDATQIERKDVKKLIVHYFQSWSNQDMDGYAGCFLPEAVVQFIDETGNIQTWAKPDFIETQRNYHRNATERVTEAPATIDIQLENNLARAVVFWKLKSKSKQDQGYDHFTLAKRNGKWRIVNLVFYTTR